MIEPSYYSKNGLSPNKAFEQGLLSYDEVIGFYKGNIIKYVIRVGDKEGASVTSDIRKAINYLHFLNEFINSHEQEKSKTVDSESLMRLKKSIEDFRNEYIIE